MCCTYSIICWSNTKRLLSVLIVFGKCFFVLKIFKNFKNYATLFWLLYLAGQASRETLVMSLLRNFHDSLASQAPSCEKDLEKSQKSGFFGFLRLSLATGSWVEALVVRFTQNDSQLTRKWTFQSWKTLRQIFQNLSHGFLATCSWLILVVKNVCFMFWGLFSGQFSKKFHFSLAYCDFS